jgi:hypothetical protein
MLSELTQHPTAIMVPKAVAKGVLIRLLAGSLERCSQGLALVETPADIRGIHAARTTKERARNIRWFVLRYGDKISAVALGLLFLLFLISALMLPFGELSSPGSGLRPPVISTLALVFAVLLFIFGKNMPVLARDQRGIRLGLYLAAIVLYAPLYSLIGFVPASSIVLFVLIKIAGEFGWLLSILTSIIGSVAVYALFAMALSFPIDAI